MSILKYMDRHLLSLMFVLTSIFIAQAQSLTLPTSSQLASITQRVGISDITITYHSPAVKERKIWGALVPFDQVWRAGANENTIVEFAHDVSVEGEALTAGRYGLYMVPKNNSVDIIFSKATQNWGTVPPTPDEIMSTITVAPIKTKAHQEWLSYDFTERGGDEVTAVLKWDNWVIPFKIKVDVNNIVLENIRAEMNGLAGFGYLGREQAAQYCLKNNIATDEALGWINASINTEKRFSNLAIKSGLLKKKGDIKGSKAAMDQALTMATPVQMNIYGYQLLNSGDTDGATSIFLKNIANTPKTHPFYWGFIDSVGEAYLKNKDKTNALKYYNMAKEYAPDQQKAYLDGVIKGIMEK